MNKDSLGARVKKYESSYNTKLTARTPVIIRVDGKAFHTFTRGCDKPFDQTLMDAMVYTTKKTAENMSGFKLAYTQSDEASFMITDFDTVESQGWFNYEVNKIVSITASLFTSYFNYYWQKHNRKPTGKKLSLAQFDARSFSVPLDDWQNVFIWRQRDWERNSIQMLGRAHFSHGELHKKKNSDIHDMLHEKGINWAKITEREKNGTFILKDGKEFHERVDYNKLAKLVGIDTQKQADIAKIAFYFGLPVQDITKVLETRDERV